MPFMARHMIAAQYIIKPYELFLGLPFSQTGIDNTSTMNHKLIWIPTLLFEKGTNVPD